MRLAMVASNPVPTTGADVCHGSAEMPPADAAGDARIASVVHNPFAMTVVSVVSPIARVVSSRSSHHVTLVLAITLSGMAWLVAIAVEPALTLNVNVPGVVTTVEIRP